MTMLRFHKVQERNILVDAKWVVYFERILRYKNKIFDCLVAIFQFKNI